MARLRMDGGGPLSLVAMDCYEDMFKEITKKLYGDDGLGDMVETPGPGGPEARPALSANYEDSGGTFRDEPLSLGSGGGGLALLSNGLSSATASGTATSESRSSRGEKSSRNENRGSGGGGEDKWFESDEVLGWTNSKVASYNPAQKIFRCVDCDCAGFLSRVAEHWLGTHANLRVFQCPRCPYTSAWARCVRMHLTRQHNEQYVDGNLWKENPVLEEVTKFLQTLKTKVESKVETPQMNVDKRYCCAFCPYATDRRDLFTRHENIHKDEKPFQCYICEKQFNRADHVKKHFLRMHRDQPYDINRIRRHPLKGHHGGGNAGNVAAASAATAAAAAITTTVPYYPKYTPLPGVVPREPDTANQPTLQPLDFYSGNSKVHHKPPPPPPPPQPPQPPQPPPQPIVVVEQHQGQPQRVAVALAIPPPPPSMTHPPLTPPLNMVRLPESHSHSHSAKGSGGSGKKKKQGDKMYSCTYCPWQGVDNWCLKRHLNTHIKPFLCALCEYKAARSERLATHVLKVHSKRVCSKCPFLADDLASLSQHLQEHHQNPLIKSGFSCNICSEYFEVRADLEAHSILEHNKLIVQCDLCDFRTTDEVSMEDHLREKHHIPDLVATGHPGEDPDFFCSECGCEFADVESLSVHQQTHHKAEVVPQGPPFVCSLCSFGCAFQSTMMEHMRVHIGSILKCQAEDCDFRSPFEMILKEHVFDSHIAVQNGGSVTRCLHCGLRVASCHVFTHHWRLHHHDLCSLCTYVYKKHFGVKDAALRTLQKSNGTLNFVIRTLSGEQPGLSAVDSDNSQAVLNGKRSRKQSCPRKLVTLPDTSEVRVTARRVKSISARLRRRRRRFQKNKGVLRELTEKYVTLEMRRGWRCRLCRGGVRYVSKTNLLLHYCWHHWYRKFQCEHCQERYRHQYQVLLHSSRAHVDVTKVALLNSGLSDM